MYATVPAHWCLLLTVAAAVSTRGAAAAPANRHHRHKRYSVHGYKWNFTELTWKFTDPHQLFQKDHDFRSARHVVERSLTLWSRASSDALRFSQVPEWSSGGADLDIYFARGDHGDFEAFDGAGGVVAHSAYPMDGQVHFDAAERWTLGGGDGLDLRYVSLHEIGHALGLRHSDSPGAVMQPIYRSRRALALAEDDVLAIRALYDTYIPKKKNMTEPDQMFKAK